MYIKYIKLLYERHIVIGLGIILRSYGCLRNSPCFQINELRLGHLEGQLGGGHLEAGQLGGGQLEPGKLGGGHLEAGHPT